MFIDYNSFLINSILGIITIINLLLIIIRFIFSIAYIIILNLSTAIRVIN